MDLVITFFRDVLDGPLYIVVAIICGILICSCIGYLGEQYLNKQKMKKDYESTHAAVVGDTPLQTADLNSVGQVTVSPTVNANVTATVGDSNNVQ